MVVGIINMFFVISTLLPWKVIQQEELTPGDHVYTYRRYGLYTHHGIYVGAGRVIHFTRTGVNETSLDSFRQEGEDLRSLHSYGYGQPLLEYWLARWGAHPTLPNTKSPEQVINKAWELYGSDNFGEYDLINNNCEHFATFCRTGVQASAQTALFSVGQHKAKEVKEWTTNLLHKIKLK
ncbi:uncharacterized protein LOC104417611 [Eucalyptus grandis]|uniref:uncharacterized protein LOC104417611 n=1 Tax=Eucalyptus grandis TaxID=71139 RepID=UPI00192EE26B|nr:uncharacterized protein LOC104417611 [Eucalyptus grandis]